MVDRKNPPETSISEGIVHIAPEELLLDNGLKVYVLPGGAEEVLKIDLVLHAGSYFQMAPLIAYATAHLLKSGIPGKSPRQINETLDHYGVVYQVDVQKDLASHSLLLMQKHLEPVLKLFAAFLHSPLFDRDEMQILLDNQKQQHLINSRKVHYLARNYFNELVFGPDHPYGSRLQTEDFDRVTHRSLGDFHLDHYHPGNGFCILSGRPPKNLHALLNRTLGDPAWALRFSRKTPEYRMHSVTEKKVMVHRPEVVQSAVRIGRRMFNRTHPDHHRLTITNALLGGYFGSRLMQNIRQDKGYTYGINSSLVSLLRDGFFFIATQVGTAVCQQAIDQIYAELKALRSLPPSHEELAGLRNYLSGQLLRSFDGPFAQSERLKELLAFQLDHKHYEAYLQELKTISPDGIMQTASRHLHEDGMIELVVGKK